MNKKQLTIIIGLQALLIVLLFWTVIYYAKDEFATFQEQEEEIEGPSRVSTEEGINTVTLPLATQLNSGIKTAKIASTSFHGEIKSFGNVVAIDQLLEGKASYLNLQSNLKLAHVEMLQKDQQYQRLKILNADDKNVSDLALQEAAAAVDADKANIAAIELQLKNLQTNLKLRWGNTLAQIASSEKLSPQLANLINKNNVLIQVSLPLNTLPPVQGAMVNITPLTESSAPIKASYISPASTSDSIGFGNTFYYSAPADSLRIGMRVNVEVEPDADNISNGVVIPSNAVVWYAGKSWAYFKQAPLTQNNNLDKSSLFVRKPISTDTEIDAGWFNQGIKPGTEIVVSGAQLLLSEEFKYLIKNENED
ncbi:efflux RND transporter periplasmic adaptor subunit [Methylotenera versatilis]|uniref:efflux RND transporter periplasmic adaptor subunit n=1 Tax=Methylotenera versatilis TaxID=1055487 RepID=UPI0006492763|nr:efflux RND transporter periplasmic adaptor subunit [Methylotenera versatilis]